MKVSTSLPFRLVYSLLQHEYLGYIFEAYAVQLDQYGHLTLKHQHITAQLASEFASAADADDIQLLQLIDGMQQDVVVKKFYGLGLGLRRALILIVLGDRFWQIHAFLGRAPQTYQSYRRVYQVGC